MRDADPDAPVEIARFFEVSQADFVVSVLAGSNIDAYVDAPHTGSIAPFYLLGSGGVRVLVRERDRERALEVLEFIVEADEHSAGNE
ncbi:MAG: DUF2007 domain-containing protein [Thermoanaerobaculia bacterium]|nr:DUF2007 domain-containing protein [Thermoanaerobaculia bacterium]